MWQVFRGYFASVNNRRWLIAIIAATALSFAAKVTIAKNTYGSLDAVLWETNLAELRHDGALALYRDGTAVQLPVLGDHHHEVFNHPPFMIRLLPWWGRLSDVSGLPLRFWVRFTCSVADVASIILLAGLMLRTQAPFQPATLFVAAASPVSFMVSGFHGNVDPIMVAFILLSACLLQGGNIWLSGMALGMAINIKIVPLIFVPAIFLYLNRRKRIEFLSGAAGVFLIASLPVIVQDPRLIWNQVFGYSPLLVTGRWGISRLVFALALDALFDTHARLAKIPLIGIIVFVSLWMNLRGRKPALPLQFGFISFLFLALTPGFGVQYLAWLVPWTCFLTVRQSLAFHLTGGLLLFCYYNRAANGLPWDLAYSGKSEWYGSVVFIGLACWLTVCCLAVCFAKRMNESRSAHSETGRKLLVAGCESGSPL